MEKQKKIVLIAITLLIIISLTAMINGEIESLGVFKQDSCISLLQSCSNCSYVNISSITSPNSSQILGQVKMTKIGTKFNYTSCNLASDLGTYIVNGFGDVDGSITVFAYDYEVTPSGVRPTTAQSGLSIGILGSMLLLMFFFGWLSFKFMETDKAFPIGVFFMLVSIIIAVYGLYLGVVYSRDYLYASTSSPQSSIFIGILYGLIGMMFLGLLGLIVMVLKEIRERKSIKQHGTNYNSHTKQYEY